MNKFTMSLKQKFLRSFKWSILGEVFSRMIRPLVFLVLAKILVPEDFGVVAAATVVVSFSQIFWDAGLIHCQRANQALLAGFTAACQLTETGDGIFNEFIRNFLSS